MNLRSVDLNLLVILHALLEERHVTRAARRLALSQPAASNALERCRQLFDDPLLERVPGGMRLTARAESLRDPLAAALAAVTQVMAPEPPDLAHLRRTVRLVMADQPGIALLQALLPALQEDAPGVDVVLLPWRGAADAMHRLETGEADLAVSLFPALPPTFRRVVAAAQHYVVAMRGDHPAAAGFDRDAWLAWPHLVVSGAGHKQGSLEAVLARHGLMRRVGAVVPGFMMVEPLLRVTDLMATVPAATLSPAHGLAVFEPPLEVADFRLHVAWHVRRDNDPAVRHVADRTCRLLGARHPDAG